VKKGDKYIMTIEDSVKKDSSKFQAKMEEKEDDIRDAFQELSVELDDIIKEAINEYCEDEDVEFDMKDIPSYKETNKIITSYIDELVKEHVQNKRKDL
jgi:oligoendopeptidase F